MSDHVVSYIPEWVPPYTVRLSKKARHLNLRICARLGFQIIIPHSCELEKLPVFLHKHRDWIEKNWRAPAPAAPESNPKSIVFSALNETWQIEYALNNRASQVEMIMPGKLLVSGRVQNYQLVKRLLKKWVYTYAEQILVNWFDAVSKQAGLTYSRISIGNATTLWGSCSAKKAISLNCKLLFLPMELVRYVMLHELCHTIHLNHSKQFWDLLEHFLPGCLMLRKQLRRSNHFIPAWFE